MMGVGISAAAQTPKALPANLDALLAVCLALRDVRAVLVDGSQFDTLLDRLVAQKADTVAAQEKLAAAQAAVDNAAAEVNRRAKDTSALADRAAQDETDARAKMASAKALAVKASADMAILVTRTAELDAQIEMQHKTANDLAIRQAAAKKREDEIQTREAAVAAAEKDIAARTAALKATLKSIS